MAKTFNKINDFTLRQAETIAEVKETLLTLEHLDQRKANLEAQLAKMPETKAKLLEGIKEITDLQKEAIKLGITAKPIAKEEINGTSLNQMV